MPVTDLNAFQTGRPWPPKEDQARLERYKQNALLFEGHSDEVFRTSSRALRPELKTAHAFVLNFHKRLSTHWADLVFSEPPGFTAGEDGTPEQDTIERLVNNNALKGTAYEVCLDTSAYGSGVFKVRLEDGKAIIEGQSPSYWFPIVNRDNVRREQAHVLAWTFKGTLSTTLGSKERTFLRLEIHERGRITHRVHTIENDNRIGREVNLQDFYPELQPVEQTGVDDFLVIPVHNLRTTRRAFGIDDYSDLDSIVIELQDRLAQMSRILDKHADPGMYGPASALEQDPLTGSWVFKHSSYIPVESEESAPGYLSWEGKLEASLAEFNELMDLLYLLAETSRAAFGQMKHGLAESGSALRRLLRTDLAKAGRIRETFDGGLKRVLKVAAALEAANGGDSVTLESIGIDWADGLPWDITEVTQAVERNIRVGVMSRFTAIKWLNPNWGPDEVQDEIDRIAEDEASTAASSPPAALNLFGGGDEE